jgi:hypothetical protein
MHVITEVMDLTIAHPWFAAFWAIVGILLGTLLTHRFSLSRDRRKEFNEVAQRIRSPLLKEHADPSPYRKVFSADDIDLFLQALPFWRRHSFRAALEKYEQAKKDAYTQEEEYGQAMYKDTAAIKTTVTRLLAYTKMR